MSIPCWPFAISYVPAVGEKSGLALNPGFVCWQSNGDANDIALAIPCHLPPASLVPYKAILIPCLPILRLPQNRRTTLGETSSMARLSSEGPHLQNFRPHLKTITKLTFYFRFCTITLATVSSPFCALWIGFCRRPILMGLAGVWRTIQAALPSRPVGLNTGMMLSQRRTK
jgi:hypothetical protein